MTNYKIGFNVYNYPPEDLLDYAFEKRLDHIEINLTQPHSSIKSFNEERIEKLNEKTSAYDIQLSFHLPTEINISDIIFYKRKKNIKYISDTIELANKLNVKNITAHMGLFFWFPIESRQRNNALKRYTKSLADLLGKCNQYNVNLALENVTPLPQGSDYFLLGDNINDLEFVFSELESPNIKFCLDTGHANNAEGVSEYIDHFKDKLAVVHFHDNNGNDDSHLPVGEGNINWKEMAIKLKEINFTGPFISECKNLKPYEAANGLRNHLI